jgi:hypothetical protein
LNLELAYFLACKFGYLLAWSTTTISYPKNRIEFPQSEAGSERIANEVYAIQCVRRVGSIAAGGSRWPFQDALALVMSQRVCTYPCCLGKLSRSKSPIRIFDDRHIPSINPETYSRVKHVNQIGLVDCQCGIRSKHDWRAAVVVDSDLCSDERD